MVRLVARSALLTLLVLAVPAAAMAAGTSGTGVTGLPGPAASTATATAALTKTVTKTVTTTVAASGSPVLVTNTNTPPSGYRRTADQVLRRASADPRVKAELRRHPKAIAYEYTKGFPTWQVSWFSDTKPQRELLQVYVDDNTGAVTQAWTGFQVAWTMARGYPGAFGRRVNSWYIWIPLLVLFVAPFIPWRRRPSLWHLDLLALASFSVSLAFFNHAKIGLSVPLVYPPLIYLLIRLLLLAGGRGIPRRPLSTIVPTPWLAIGAVFLMAFRIGLNILNSNVIDVGYSGVIGADKLIHNVALYGHWPHDNMYGDTYGPVSYFLYIPFRLIFGWSGSWDSLPAAHGAAIFFDVLCVAGLFLLGRRLRGNRLGVVLAYLWAAYPFTLYALNSNTNDALVGAALIFALLAIRTSPARGLMAGLAGMTKFAPFALAPLLLRGTEERLRWRHIVGFGIAFAIACVAVMIPVLAKHDLSAFWHDSITYQSDRTTPFSIWGLWGGLGWVQSLLQGAVIALALGVAFLPARRTLVDVAALGAAVLVALQLTLNYWLYPYIVWFFPMALVALVASHPEHEPPAAQVYDDAAEPEHPPVPIHITSS
ncbi:MAG TPA: glycosyltransferase family 87 protein [Solirubrobacteraceae bacterium]